MNSKEILKSIINNFDINQFELFFRQKNDKLRFFYEDLNIKIGDNFNDFKECKKIAEGKLDDGNLIICSFLVTKALKERSGKKLQYDLGKKILKQENSDAGIFIFYDEHGNFRFSLIYTNYLGKKRDFSSFKRFTYFVSKDQTNKTFLSQIGEGDLSTIEKIKEAFSVEKVTKEFYTEIANWYFWAIDNSHFPEAVEKEENGRNMAIIKLITRLIFIWFMREENLVPKELFDKNRLKLIINDIDPDSSSYYLAILQNLFFATLNTKKEERQFRTEVRGLKGYNPDFGNQYVFRHHSYFINPEKIKDYFGDIPFLNGGLFECLDDGKNDNYIDGFTERKSYQPKVPNRLFFSEEEVINLNKYYGTENKRYKVKGILNILSSFNFTIDENSSDDADVALDPELLGRVFENLLASFNPETATTARKATGSYYTPREIVDYMVEESLRQYFKSNLTDIENIDEKLDNLFSTENDKNPFNDNESKKVVKLIENVRIVDPAVGSGAFPMGELNKMVFILNKIDPKNELWKQAQIEVAELIPDAEVRNNTINQIENYFTTKQPDYFRKLYLIQKCIYGVDIQQIAVEISKLRFFISLLVDEDKNDIQPLPNLDFKIMQGNSLIEFVSYMQKNDDKWNAMVNQITILKEHLFNTYDHKEKDKIRKEIDRLIIELFNYDNNTEIEQMEKKITNIQLSQRLFDDGQVKKEDSKEIEKIKEEIKEKRKNIVKDFGLAEHFEWHINFAEVFKEKGGFDIVISNPPYIQLQKIHHSADLYKNENYQTFDRRGDIYCLFYERGINLLRDSGHLAFITSNKWMRAEYGRKLRSFFLKYNPKILIDLGPAVFESATVDTSILIIQKSANNHQLRAVTIKENKKENIDFNIYLKEKGVILRNLGENAWFIGDDVEQKLKEKIERIGKPLKEWDVKIYYGIKTGLNEAFIIDSAKREEILNNCKDENERKRTEAIIKPILRGRDIKRYYYEWKDLWVIIIPAGWTNKNRSNETPETFIKKTFSSLMTHLQQFQEKAKKREDQGDYWWELRQCAYYSEFEKEKVAWTPVNSEYSFTIIPPHVFFLNSVFMITGKNIKTFCAVFNSTLMRYYLTFLFSSENNYTYASKETIEKIPLPPIAASNESIVQQIETLVDKILAITKDKDYLQNSEKQVKVKEYERQIDQLVYQLYSLTPEEIEIVEQSANKN